MVPVCEGDKGLLDLKRCERIRSRLNLVMRQSGLSGKSPFWDQTTAGSAAFQKVPTPLSSLRIWRGALPGAKGMIKIKLHGLRTKLSDCLQSTGRALG